MLKVIFIFLLIFGVLSATIFNGKKLIGFVAKNCKIVLVIVVSAVVALGIVFI